MKKENVMHFHRKWGRKWVLVMIWVSGLGIFYEIMLVSQISQISGCDYFLFS